MGFDKARITVDGVPMLQRVFSVAHGLSEDVMVVGKSASDYSDLVPEAQVIADYDPASSLSPFGKRRNSHQEAVPRLGPLAGIAAALATAHHEMVVILACDLPRVRLDVLKLLVSLAPGFDAVVPTIVNDRPEPLHAVYRRTCLNAIIACLQRGDRKASAFFRDIAVRQVYPDEMREVDPKMESFLNVNTLRDRDDHHTGRMCC